MTNYIALRISVSPYSEDLCDLIAASLADVGYESFETIDGGMIAYIVDTDFNLDKAKEVLTDLPIAAKLSYESELIEGKDWNEEWEKNYFQPIVIDNRCVVHSTFHKDVPNADIDIVIDPKMAFGTGHHSTTGLMMRYLLEMNLNGKQIIDMGTGTGILAILSKKLGAKSVAGIEIDEGAYDNALLNAELNDVELQFIHSDVKGLEAVDEKCDLFIANINRNIILADIEAYAAALKEGGEMLLSGFYEKDIPIIESRAKMIGLEKLDYKMDNDWVAVRLHRC
jgi:ribosomal protein L11 methyltransferase